jgi:hypothetical protein
MENKSTYLSDQELVDFKKIAKAKHSDMTKLLKQAISNYPKNLVINKITNVESKKSRCYLIEQDLNDILLKKKLETGHTISAIIYALILNILKKS